MIRRMLLLACAALLGGCPRTFDSNEVNVDDIAQAYEVSFDGETDRTTVRAAFLTGRGADGSFFFPGVNVRDYVRLVRPSYVEHDSIPMRSIDTADSVFQVGSVRYEGETDGFVGYHLWRWMDKDGGLHENALTLEVVDFVDPPLVISKSALPEIRFTPARGLEDEVYLRLGREPDSTTAIGYAPEPSDTTIEFSPGEIDGVEPGLYFLRLERRVWRSLQEETRAGGRLSGTALSAAIEIEVVD